MNFFFFVAEELRQIMAKLGFRSVNEMVGRVDKLKATESHRPLEGEGAGSYSRSYTHQMWGRRLPAIVCRNRTTVSRTCSITS